MTNPVSFGRYQIKRELGKGGMSTVYLAHDPRFGRDVALKVMLTAFREDATFRGRFEREARTIAALEHPAIVPVYDFGEDQDQLYLVMRYMTGGSLAEHIYVRPFSLQETIPFIIRIADALQHAHEQGVIHRDLKPANILFDQYHNPFLSDFGIVKLAEGTTGYTGSGVLGTPAYMSPEQIHSEDELDGRSDTYTLGILMFEMLTGIKPYRADTPVKQMMAHVLNPIPNIRDQRPDLPAALEPIVHTVLAKQRSERYASAAEFSTALADTFPEFAIPSPTKTNNIRSKPLPSTAVPDEPTATNLPLDQTETAVIPPQPQPTPQPTPTPTPTPAPAQQSTQLQPIAISSLPDPPTQPASPPPQRRRWPYWLIGTIAILAILVGIASSFLPITRRNPVEVAPTAVIVAINPSDETATAVPPTPAIIEVAVTVTTASATPTTAVPQTERQIALSALGSPIVAQQFGSGDRHLLLIGGLHSGFAPGGVALAEQLAAYFDENTAAIPADLSIWIITNLNPDSATEPGELPGRLNGNGVDLNRNWGCLWQPSPTWRSTPIPGLGGTSPFSEPEIAGLANFIQEIEPKVVVFWGARATNGLVSAGSCDERPYVSADLGRAFSNGSGYQYVNFEGLTEQKIPGDGTNWLDQQGIPAITVLLPEYSAVDFNRNLAGIQALIDALATSKTDIPPQ